MAVTTSADKIFTAASATRTLYVQEPEYQKWKHTHNYLIENFNYVPCQIALPVTLFHLVPSLTFLIFFHVTWSVCWNIFLLASFFSFFPPWILHSLLHSTVSVFSRHPRNFDCRFFLFILNRQNPQHLISAYFGTIFLDEKVTVQLLKRMSQRWSRPYSTSTRCTINRLILLFSLGDKE